MPKLEPLAPERRHPADYRDEIEHAEVTQVLTELPEDHPACLAYASGARGASDSLSMTHLLSDRADLVARLVVAYLGHGARINAKGNSTGALMSRAGTQ